MCCLIREFAKQPLNAKRRRGAIGLARHGAERREIAVDDSRCRRVLRGTRRDRQSAARNATLVRGPRINVRSSASASRSSAASPCRPVGDELGDHRVVVGRHLAARLDAAVDADIVAAIAAQQSCRSTAESRSRDPPHRCALRRRDHRSGLAPGSAADFSPAATRNCHSTRSSPVISSVTGCSTCSRVFISMNQNAPARRPRVPSATNSMVPAPA